MPTEQKMLYCPHCKVKTLHIQKTPNHLLHLILAIITGGLWIIIWIFQSKEAPQCTQCGNITSENTNNNILNILGWATLIFLLIISISAITKKEEKIQTNTTAKSQANTIKPEKTKFAKKAEEYCSLLESINLKTHPMAKLKEGGHSCLPIKNQLSKNKATNLSYYVYSKNKVDVSQINFIANIADTETTKAENELIKAVNMLFTKMGLLTNNSFSDLVRSKDDSSSSNGQYKIMINKKRWDAGNGQSIYISIQ